MDSLEGGKREDLPYRSRSLVISLAFGVETTVQAMPVHASGGMNHRTDIFLVNKRCKVLKQATLLPGVEKKRRPLKSARRHSWHRSCTILGRSEYRVPSSLESTFGGKRRESIGAVEGLAENIGA